MLIGLTGISGSGKDTLATFISQYLNEIDHPCLVTHVIRPLKTFLEDTYGLEHLSLDDPKQKALGPHTMSYHQFMVELFHLWERFDPNKLAQNRWISQEISNAHNKGFETVIVNSIRHPKEAEIILSKGGSIVTVFGRGEPRTSDCWVQDIDREFSRVRVNNDSTLEALQVRARQLTYKLFLHTSHP